MASTTARVKIFPKVSPYTAELKEEIRVFDLRERQAELTFTPPPTPKPSEPGSKGKSQNIGVIPLGIFTTYFTRGPRPPSSMLGD